MAWSRLGEENLAGSGTSSHATVIPPACSVVDPTLLSQSNQFVHNPHVIPGSVAYTGQLWAPHCSRLTMRTAQAVLLAAAGVAATATTLPAGYVHTPAGAMRADCVHEVPSGAEVAEIDGTVLVSVEGVPVSKHSVCVDDAELGPVMAPRPASPKLRARGLQLPADYGGWIEYTAANVADSYDTFLGYFSVPDVPPSALPSWCSALSTQHAKPANTAHRPA